MVAGQTTGASVVVLPHGRCSDDIVDRTHLLALAALDTDISIDSEFLVGDHPFVEIAADDV